MNPSPRRRFTATRAFRPVVTCLVLSSQLLVMLGMPIPCLSSAESPIAAPCASATCCCPTAEQCQQLCCCLPVHGDDLQNPSPVRANASDEESPPWTLRVQNRTCGGLSSFWAYLLTPALIPPRQALLTPLQLLDWLPVDSHFAAAGNLMPATPPPRGRLA